MRSTKASAAIDRLKRRSDNPLYSMSMSSAGLFSLQYGPQIVKRVSKLDVAFSKQLQKKTT
jgi:hypothetical protein